jgi:hypothetical protein
MKAKIKQVSTPRVNSDYWDDEWHISLNKRVVAVAWDEADAKLIVKALRQYKSKKKKVKN